jgi:hypothetical protein
VDATGARAHTILTASSGTPGNQGLLPVALAEARVAAEHASHAARASDDLTTMREHARAVVHAVDPTRVTAGPGLGYGVRRAVAELAEQLTLARAADPTVDVATAAPSALAAAGHVLGWADALVTVAERIERAGSVAEGAPLAAELVTLTRRLSRGVDVDGDGHVTYAPGEAGLHLLEVTVSLFAQGRDAQSMAEERVR